MMLPRRGGAQHAGRRGAGGAEDRGDAGRAGVQRADVGPLIGLPCWAQVAPPSTVVTTVPIAPPAKQATSLVHAIAVSDCALLLVCALQVAPPSVDARSVAGVPDATSRRRRSSSYREQATAERLAVVPLVAGVQVVPPSVVVEDRAGGADRDARRRGSADDAGQRLRRAAGLRRPGDAAVGRSEDDGSAGRDARRPPRRPSRCTRRRPGSTVVPLVRGSQVWPPSDVREDRAGVADRDAVRGVDAAEAVHLLRWCRRRPARSRCRRRWSSRTRGSRPACRPRRSRSPSGRRPRPGRGRWPSRWSGVQVPPLSTSTVPPCPVATQLVADRQAMPVSCAVDVRRHRRPGDAAVGARDDHARPADRVAGASRRTRRR